MEIFEEIHNKFHGAVDAIVMILKQMQLEDCFNIIGLTSPDESVADQAIVNSLNSKRMTYSNANGELKSSTHYIRKALKLSEPPAQSQYSTLQSITQYFIDFVFTNTARNSKEALKLQLVARREDIFQVPTNIEENKAFLPLLFSLGMFFGCPYAGSISLAIWVMRKEVLYVIAAAFGILEIDIADVIYEALQNDMNNVVERRPIFCLPVWRALFSMKRSYRDEECVSHVPTTQITFVDIFRYAEIIDRTIGIQLQNDEEMNVHYDRIAKTYYRKGDKKLTAKEISAILMFEQNRRIGGHFRPRLLWVKYPVGGREDSKQQI